MSSCSGLLKAEKRRRPHTSMYEMVVNLYKSFVCSGTEGRDNKAHWLCADSANCWQEKKKKEKKERKKSSQSIPETRNTDRSRSHFSPKSGRLWKAQTSPWAKQVNIISWMHVFFCHADQHTLFIKKSVWSCLIAVVHSQIIINYFSIQLFFPVFIVLRWEQKNKSYSRRRAVRKQSLGAQPLNLLF